MKKILFIIILLSPVILVAQDDKPVNEDEMFSNPETVVDNKKFEKKNADEDQNKKSIGLSGEILSVNQYAYRDDANEIPGMKKHTNTPYIMGTLFTDIRLPSDVKGFGSFDAVYNASLNETDFNVKELFVDFNIGRASRCCSGGDAIYGTRRT
jgi:hypothetical protein